MKTLKFLKLFENFIILNFFEILLNFNKFELQIIIFLKFFNMLISKKQFLCNKKTILHSRAT